MFDAIDETVLVIAAIVIVILQVVFLLVAWLGRLEKVTDVAAGITFSAVALTSFIISQVRI